MKQGNSTAERKATTNRISVSAPKNVSCDIFSWQCIFTDWVLCTQETPWNSPRKRQAPLSWYQVQDDWSAGSRNSYKAGNGRTGQNQMWVGREIQIRFWKTMQAWTKNKLLVGGWQLKNIYLVDSWTFLTVMTKLQERKKISLISVSFYSLGKGWTQCEPDSRADKNQLLYPWPQFPRCRVGKLLFPSAWRKKIMKMMEVEQIPDRLKCRHQHPAPSCHTENELLILDTAVSVTPQLDGKKFPELCVSHKNPLQATTWICVPLLNLPELRE